MKYALLYSLLERQKMVGDLVVEEIVGWWVN